MLLTLFLEYIIEVKFDIEPPHDNHALITPRLNKKGPSMRFQLQPSKEGAPGAKSGDEWGQEDIQCQQPKDALPGFSEANNSYYKLSTFECRGGLARHTKGFHQAELTLEFGITREYLVSFES